ncbi:translation initiation factor IF-2 subunit beta [Candidatus Woesearchaeota archaeon]|nr:translation initiation factor IF-2 subunit beta [Candidatus Woesearchaeota archaeon]
MKSYEEMLEEAKSKLPEVAIAKERFELSKVKGHLEGNKTVISNFSQICSSFDRDQAHLLKFLQRELATPAAIDGPRLILGRKISSARINEKIQQYARDFVICKECGKPDTKVIKEERFHYLRCTACGAKQPIVAKL